MVGMKENVMILYPLNSLHLTFCFSPSCDWRGHRDQDGCNECKVTLNVASCFGFEYTFDDLERKTTYRFTIQSHNPSGFSKPALIIYPID